MEPPKTNKSNLYSINSTFQLHCWNYISTSSLSSIILRDFPSQISNPSAHFKIYGLDNFAYFLHSINSFPDFQTLVFTQRFNILSKLVSADFSIQRPFKLFSRSNSVSPFELQFIEISSVIPQGVFQKTTSLQYLSSFKVLLTNKKGPFLKSFHLFQLDINPISELNTLYSPMPVIRTVGFSSCSDFDTFESTCSPLSNINIPYTTTNDLQATLDPLSYALTFHFVSSLSLPSSSFQSSLDQLDHILDPLSSFTFCALSAGAYAIPSLASICFLPKRQVDSSIIIPLLRSLSIPHLVLPIGLVFSASLEAIEEVLLLAPQQNISVPSHFLQSIQKFSFELVDSTIKISLLKLTTPHFTELQILHLDPGCPNDIFFTQAFLDFIKIRFFCVSSAQLQLIKDGSGNIHEVLAFSSSAKLSTSGRGVMGVPKRSGVEGGKSSEERNFKKQQR